MEANIKKAPLYKKWWVWIILYLMTAIIVQMIENRVSEIALQPEEIQVAQADDQDNKVASEALPVMANPENQLVTLRIGTDMPAGEYLATAIDDNAPAYLLLTRDPYLDKHSVIWQRHFENHTIVTVTEGTYLSMKNTNLIPIDSAIVPGLKGDTLLPGTYRIGIDIPPGVYTFFPIEGGTGFFKLAENSSNLVTSIHQSQNFTEPVTLFLAEGLYLTFMRAEIKK